MIIFIVKKGIIFRNHPWQERKDIIFRVKFGISPIGVINENFESSPDRTEPKRLPDPDLRGAEKAIQRAALKARERARRFGHGIIIFENGKIVEEFPDRDIPDEDKSDEGTKGQT